MAPKVNLPFDSLELFGAIIRYGIIIVLFTIVFINIFNTNVQFMMFIILLIIIIFGTAFVVRDIIFTKSIFNESNEITSLITTSVGFRNIFLFAFAFGVIFKIISVTLFIIVLNYGRSQLTNNNNVTNTSLTTDNSITFKTYIETFIVSSIFLALLAAMIFLLYVSYELRYAILNITALLLSLSVLGLCSYEMYNASRFFNIYKTKGLVYQTY